MQDSSVSHPTPLPFDPNAAAAPDSGIFGLPHDSDAARVVLIPVPFEATTSYGGGTSEGPQAILAASHQVDLFDINVGRPYEAGIHMLAEDLDILEWNGVGKVRAQGIITSGGVNPDIPDLVAAAEEVNALGAQLNERVEAIAEAWLSKNKIVGVVGGDHATPFGAIKAHARHFPGLGVLHFDAHADLREAYEGFTWSHASIMFNVMERIPEVARLVQVGIRDFCEDELDYIQGSDGRIVTYFDAQLKTRTLEGIPFSKSAEAIAESLPRDVYVSFDIDGLDPTLCPHTGTPVPGGLQLAEAVAILDAVVASGRRIVGFDLNEVSPGPEGDEWDANVGARVLYKLIGYTLLSRGIGRRPRIPWPAAGMTV